MAEPKRTIRGVLDTAILVFVVLVVGLIAWKLIAGVLGTIVFFVKLFLFALAVAALLRTWLWIRGRRSSRSEAQAAGSPLQPRR